MPIQPLSGSLATTKRTHGFTYVGLMIAILLISLASLATVETESFRNRRFAEERLLTTGDAYLAAIRAYAGATPPGGQTYPSDLKDLLKDPRSPGTKRFLRTLYVDPLTGKVDWGIVQSPTGGIAGVYSKAPGVPIKQANFPRPFLSFAGSTSYRQWTFAFRPVGADSGRTEITTPSVTSNPPTS